MCQLVYAISHSGAGVIKDMNFAAFTSYMLLMTFTPGPNNIMSMANAAKHGFKRGLRFNFGVLAGCLIVITGCAVFTTFLYDLMPQIEPVMVCVGTAYILWLAWSVWRNAPKDGKKWTMETNSIITGMVLQLVNVKIIFYGITAMSTFIMPHYRGFAALFPFVLLMAFTGFLGTCCWALSGALFVSFFAKHKKMVNACLALMLIYCALSQLLGVYG